MRFEVKEPEELSGRSKKSMSWARTVLNISRRYLWVTWSQLSVNRHFLLQYTPSKGPKFSKVNGVLDAYHLTNDIACNAQQEECTQISKCQHEEHKREKIC